MASDDPAAGRMHSSATRRARAIARVRPLPSTGGDVLINQSRSVVLSPQRRCSFIGGTAVEARARLRDGNAALNLLRWKHLPLAVKFVHDTAPHHEADIFESRHVVERASADRDNIRILALLDCA